MLVNLPASIHTCVGGGGGGVVTVSYIVLIVSIICVFDLISFLLVKTIRATRSIHRSVL